MPHNKYHKKGNGGTKGGTKDKNGVVQGTSDYKPMTPSKMYIDGMDVATMPSGSVGMTSRLDPVEKPQKRAVGQVSPGPMTTGPKNPGATMKAIRNTNSKKVKVKPKTNYNSTASDRGTATPQKKSGSAVSGW